MIELNNSVDAWQVCRLNGGNGGGIGLNRLRLEMNFLGETRQGGYKNKCCYTTVHAN
jgi:hypothetical protein